MPVRAPTRHICAICGRLADVTTAGPEDPQPRDIVVEQETAEVEADLEAQSEPEGDES